VFYFHEPGVYFAYWTVMTLLFLSTLSKKTLLEIDRQGKNMEMGA